MAYKASPVVWVEVVRPESHPVSPNTFTQNMLYMQSDLSRASVDHGPQGRVSGIPTGLALTVFLDSSIFQEASRSDQFPACAI